MPKKEQTASDERELVVKVLLIGTKPPIWRRLSVREGMTLADLHHTIQIAMGWLDCHLHAFAVKGTRYSTPSPYVDNDFDSQDATKVTLRDLRLRRIGSRFDYEYDFGDGWLHSIVVEAIKPLADRSRYPRCIGGRRACPPEDSGGVYGYSRLLSVISDPSHPEQPELREWLHEDFDPAAFSVDEVNEALDGQFSGRLALK